MFSSWLGFIYFLNGRDKLKNFLTNLHPLRSADGYVWKLWDKLLLSNTDCITNKLAYKKKNKPICLKQVTLEVQQTILMFHFWTEEKKGKNISWSLLVKYEKLMLFFVITDNKHDVVRASLLSGETRPLSGHVFSL